MAVFRLKLAPHEAAVLEIMAQDEGKRPEEKMRDLLRDGAMRWMGGSKRPSKVTQTHGNDTSDRR